MLSCCPNRSDGKKQTENAVDLNRDFYLSSEFMDEDKNKPDETAINNKNGIDINYDEDQNSRSGALLSPPTPITNEDNEANPLASDPTTKGFF